MTGRDLPTGGSGDGWLLAAAGLVDAGGLLWAAGAAATLAAGDRLERGHLAAGLLALAHPGDPGRAWGGPVGPVWAYWCVTAAVVGLVAAGVFGLWRLLSSSPDARRAVRFEGLAGRRELRRVAGRRTLLARSATLRPGLSRPAPHQVGYRLGAAAGVDIWASVEDSMLVVGPPRSGKRLARGDPDNPGRPRPGDHYLDPARQPSGQRRGPGRAGTGDGLRPPRTRPRWCRGAPRLVTDPGLRGPAGGDDPGGHPGRGCRAGGDGQRHVLAGPGDRGDPLPAARRRPRRPARRGGVPLVARGGRGA